MSQLISHIHTNSADYQANFAHNKQLAEQLHAHQQQAATERPSRTVERHRQRGKLLVRERIDEPRAHGPAAGIVVQLRSRGLADPSPFGAAEQAQRGQLEPLPPGNAHGRSERSSAPPHSPTLPP